MYLFQSLFNLRGDLQLRAGGPDDADHGAAVGRGRACPGRSRCWPTRWAPVSSTPSRRCRASLIGVLGVARVDWVKWAKFQIKMQGFFFADRHGHHHHRGHDQLPVSRVAVLETGVKGS